MIVGYDLDGTICEKSSIDKKWGDCNGMERKAFQLIRETHYKTAQLVFRPVEKEYTIITARNKKYAEITLQWLVLASLSPISIHFIDRARTRDNMIEYKSEKINELGLDKYYEDDEKIVSKLRKLCQSTEIILVTPITRNYILNNFLHPPLQF
jgi:hypothetical protein